jgi:thiol peroxidase
MQSLLFATVLSMAATPNGGPTSDTASHFPTRAASNATFQGQPVRIAGTFPQEGAVAKEFSLTGNDLQPVTLKDLGKTRKVLNIFVSIDTPVCDVSVRKFNQLAAGMKNTTVLGISADLPFAQQRFCGAAGIDNVKTLSTFRSSSFATDYGVAIEDGVLDSLTARAVIVLDENNRVIYSQRVDEITDEPDYDGVLKALQAAS